MSNIRFINRKPNRLKNYDYSQSGYYFVTICTGNKQNWLGEIVNEQMILSDYGAIVAHYWQEIPAHYPNVELDKWEIMPDHIHGIVIIQPLSSVGTAYYAVPTKPKPVSLSQIVQSFKAAAVKHIRIEFNDMNFKWQRSFYDHVIRNEAALARMREYIVNNFKQRESGDKYQTSMPGNVECKV